MPIVEAAYRFAALHPEVLTKMPCFCGCEHRSHRHNDDCFVSARDERGRVTAWEPHGIACGICLDVAREAMQGFEQGMPLSAIRAGIEAKHRPRFPTMTPTPPIGK
jgi:hypothetical protein